MMDGKTQITDKDINFIQDRSLRTKIRMLACKASLLSFAIESDYDHKFILRLIDIATLAKGIEISAKPFEAGKMLLEHKAVYTERLNELTEYFNQLYEAE